MKLPNRISGFFTGLLLMVVSALMLLTLIVVGSFMANFFVGLVVLSIILLIVGYILMTHD